MVSGERSGDGVSGFTSSVAWFSVIILILIFLARAGHFFMYYLHEMYYGGGMKYHVLILILLLIGLFYLLAAVGFFMGRPFGRDIAYFLVFLDSIFSGFFLYNLYYALLSLVVIVLLLVLLHGSKPYFKKFNDVDAKVEKRIVIVVVLYILLAVLPFE